eukprot:c18531_g1_i2.p1 GENE.c18531_g1_i2~~c18531_g1_i2.p1  ORF type:complete len:141 (-),score=41.17 c18531_g1_i2:42-464(-)
MGIFLFPAKTLIPFHDHPKMSVITLNLFGSARVRVLNPESNKGKLEAFEVLDRVTNAGEMLTCFPNHGNIHQIEAITNFAMLDIFLPPYDHITRVCHYFKVSPLKRKENGRNYFDIQSIPDPYIEMIEEPYQGQRITIDI